MSYFVAFITLVFGIIAGIFFSSGRSPISNIRERANRIREDHINLERSHKSVADSITRVQDSTREVGKGIDGAIDKTRTIDESVNRAISTLERIRKRGDKQDKPSSESGGGS